MGRQKVPAAHCGIHHAPARASKMRWIADLRLRYGPTTVDAFRRGWPARLDLMTQLAGLRLRDRWDRWDG
ncbi:hypothetical protein [Streptomyces sp. NPDC048623]|uniref:hypothetical protein n=1 Tax=Streptomyces sp. NPDC048623 TaxID=3155761 RepID=UPI003431E3CD